MVDHWSEDHYWTESSDRFAELRRQGLSKLVVDLDAIESEIFSCDSPAYRAMVAMASVWQHEGMDGHKGAPRIALALLLLLSEMNKTVVNKKSMPKIIYVLTNEAMPALPLTALNPV